MYCLYSLRDRIQLCGDVNGLAMGIKEGYLPDLERVPFFKPTRIRIGVVGSGPDHHEGYFNKLIPLSLEKSNKIMLMSFGSGIGNVSPF